MCGHRGADTPWVYLTTACVYSVYEVVSHDTARMYINTYFV